MNWEQKLQAFQAIADHSLRMRAPGDWYVEGRLEMKESAGSCVLIGKYGNGVTPQAAVEDHWRVLVEELPDAGYLVTNAGRETRKHVRWNGFMWAEVGW